MPATPATIAAETAAAHQTEYEPVLPLADIEVHPTNVRHDAIADDELVQSIAAMGVLEPVLVAPHPDPDGPFKWRMLAGHRRKDGSEKAGHTSVPAIIRYDLVDEADQIATMLIENGRRNGLTPIEEAEGFDLLTGLGWDIDRIAHTYGCSASTVRSRRKLTTLKPSFQEQVAAGQVTLDDALTLAALPEKEQKRLEQIPASQINYELKRSQARVEQEERVAKEIDDLRALGGSEQKMPKNGYYYSLRDEAHGMTAVANMPLFLREPAAHTHGCLGWVDNGTAQYPSVGVVCTNVSAHDDEIAAHHAQVAADRSDEEKAAQAEREARAAEAQTAREEREAAAESRRVAARMRGDVVIEASRKVKIPPVLEPILRGALTGLLNDWPMDERLFQDLAGVPDDMRWTSYDTREPYLAQITTMAPAALWRAFIAASTAHVESGIDFTVQYAAVEGVAPWEALVYGQYLDALTLAGHQLTPPDEDLQRVLDTAADTDGDES